jgi:hypothetical protein
LGLEELHSRLKQKTSADAENRAKSKPELNERNVIEIEDVLDVFEHLDELPEMQELIYNMNMEE